MFITFHFVQINCRFETWATSFTPQCLCLSDKTLHGIGPFYLASMSREVNVSTQTHGKTCLGLTEPIVSMYRNPPGRCISCCLNTCSNNGVSAMRTKTHTVLLLVFYYYFSNYCSYYYRFYYYCCYYCYY